MIDWINVVVQGTLLGGLFALYALGLSLAFGVMRFANIAHGDFIVLAAYFVLSTCQGLEISPIVALVITLPVAVLFGWVVQTLLFERVSRQDPLVALLVAFGLSIIIQNSLLDFYGADPRKLNIGDIEQMSIEPISGLHIGVFSLIIFLTAVTIILCLQAVIYRTAFGRSLRAVSDNQANAHMIGLDTRRILRYAFGLIMVLVLIAALMMGIKTSFDPASGPTRLLIAFESVVIGGLGNLWGTLAGGVILGVAQMVGAQYDAAWQLLAGDLVFLLILILRPQGLFPRLEG